MSIETTRTFFDENAALRDHVEHFLLAARELPDLSPPERIELVERIVAFLADVLLPHTEAEERVLYPEARRLLGGAETSADVAADRAQVRTRLHELAEADVEDTGQLQELLYALYALLSAHFWRKESLYLRLLQLRPEQSADALLGRVERYERRRRPLAGGARANAGALLG